MYYHNPTPGNEREGEGFTESLVLFVTGTATREEGMPENHLLLRSDDATIQMKKGSEFAKLSHALVDRYNSYPDMYRALKDLVQYIEWREDFVVEDAEQGNENAYSKAKAILNSITGGK